MGFTFLGSVGLGDNSSNSGISSFASYNWGNQPVLYAGSATTGDLSYNYIYDDRGASQRGITQATDTMGTNSLSSFELVMLNETPYLLTSGRYDDNASLISINSDGNYGASFDISGTGDDYSRFLMTETVYVGDRVYTFGVQHGASGVQSYRIMDDLSFKDKRDYADTNDTFLGDVTAMDSLANNGKTYLVSVSGFDAGVQSYVVGQHGNLRSKDQVSPFDGEGFALSSDVELVMAGGEMFAILASAGTDSLTVYHMNGGGQLTETDHMLDTIDTRFRDVEIVESVTFQGRPYVFVSGSDDGLTVFELLPNGQLNLIEVLADDFHTTLNNIKAIELVEVDGSLQVFVSSESEGGFTQFNYEPPSAGDVLIGDKTKDDMSGSADNDILMGMGKGDALVGGAGDDILDGGKGRDVMEGGLGADTFILAPDGRRDVISDFQKGQDKIDVSQFALVGDVESVEIKSRPWGAIVVVNDEVIRVETADGSRIERDGLSNDDFIFV